jgi:hypothetical protein
VLALDFVLSLLIVIHSMLLPDFICISELLFCASHCICLLCPNCYSMLIPELFLSLQIAVPCLSLTLSCLSELLFRSYRYLCLVCPNCYSVHIDGFYCLSKLLFRAYRWLLLSVRIVILCLSLTNWFAVLIPDLSFSLILLWFFVYSLDLLITNDECNLIQT